MEFRDYYQTLGVARDAPADDIKKAFRKLARKYHPDVSREPDAAKRMAQINEANTVLSELVVGGALFGIGEDRVGLVDLRHALGGVRLPGEDRKSVV